MGFEAVQARTNRGCAGWEGCGITPPTCRNHRQATVIDTPADAAASATTIPDLTAAQKLRCTATGIAGRPPTLTRHLINQGVALTG
jgi:hypothetical protein